MHQLLYLGTKSDTSTNILLDAVGGVEKVSISKQPVTRAVRSTHVWEGN